MMAVERGVCGHPKRRALEAGASEASKEGGRSRSGRTLRRRRGRDVDDGREATPWAVASPKRPPLYAQCRGDDVDDHHSPVRRGRDGGGRVAVAVDDDGERDGEGRE